MLNSISAKISQNKNILMLLSAGIYAIALYSVLSDKILIYSCIMLLASIFLLLKNSFSLKYIIIWNLLFYLGILNTSYRIRDVDELLSLAPVNSEITGKIISIPQKDIEGSTKFFFDVEKIRFNSIEKRLNDEKILVTLNSNKPINDLKIYNSTILKGRLSTPFKAGNPSQFDYGNYLRNHGAYAVFYAKDFSITPSKLSIKEKTLQGINDYREKILGIHSKYLPSPNLEILGGIVFGDDAVSPPKNIKQSFASSGLLHILAASGMNVAFIYGFFFWIFSRLRINFKLSVILGMLMVIIYTLMTGLGPSIIRAACMLLFVLAGKLIDRDAHSISLLSFVGLLMLLYNPLYINDVGFQLSFIVTFGILLMSPIIIRLNNKFYDYVVAAIAIPIIAQLWVIPIQIFYFNNISLYSVFANIMSTPIIAIISFGGFISSLLSAIAPISDFICRVFDFILNPIVSTLVNISDFWGHLPNSTIQTSHPSVFQIFIYYGMLLAFTGLLFNNIRAKYKRTLLVSVLSLSLVLLITLLPIKNNNLEIMTFDVGNADCFLIKTPANEYIMIDTGRAGYKGGKSQAEIIVLRYLKDKGIKNLDSLIITHFDNDHCGGAVDVIKGLKVNKIYVNNTSHNSRGARAIYKSIGENSKLILGQNEQIIYNENGLKLTNLLGASSDSDNENSILTLLEYNNFTMLFTGDAGITGLKNVLNKIPKDITVLKVPHHGASGGLDNEIMKHLSPSYSIISVGENKFGHPTVYTLAMLKDSKILRTDIDNAILIRVSKKKTSVMTYDPKKKRFD